MNKGIDRYNEIFEATLNKISAEGLESLSAAFRDGGIDNSGAQIPAEPAGDYRSVSGDMRKDSATGQVTWANDYDPDECRPLGYTDFNGGGNRI